MFKQGYEHYIAYSNTILDYYTIVPPDLYIIFSTENITASSAYNYIIPSGSIRYIIRTPNYSTSQYGVNTARIVTENFSGNLSINVYEHVYSNAEYSSTTIQPDILQEGSYSNVYMQANSIILATFLLVFCFLQMWKIHK